MQSHGAVQLPSMKQTGLLESLSRAGKYVAQCEHFIAQQKLIVVGLESVTQDTDHEMHTINQAREGLSLLQELLIYRIAERDRLKRSLSQILS